MTRAEEVVDSDSKAKEGDEAADKAGHEEDTKEDLLEDKLDGGEEGKHVQVLLPQALFESGIEICIGIV